MNNLDDLKAHALSLSRQYFEAIKDFRAIKFELIERLQQAETERDALKAELEAARRRTPQTPQQILARANALAREFYGIRGYVVPEGYQFHAASHPHEREAWQLTIAAFEALECTDLEDALTELEDE
jgi:hypothetical protein